MADFLLVAVICHLLLITILYALSKDYISVFLNGSAMVEWRGRFIDSRHRQFVK
jgi:hypothetical protein